MCTFKDVLRWSNNKNDVPTLEPLQKTVDFHHDKGIDMLKHGFTSPIFANICLQKSTTAKFYPFIQNYKGLLGEVLEDLASGLSIVLTRKAVVDETFNRYSTNWCEANVGTDAS